MGMNGTEAAGARPARIPIVLRPRRILRTEENVGYVCKATEPASLEPSMLSFYSDTIVKTRTRPLARLQKNDKTKVGLEGEEKAPVFRDDDVRNEKERKLGNTDKLIAFAEGACGPNHEER